MATKRENQLAMAGTIEKRVKASESLLERMGITPEAYERVVLNALIRNPDLQDCDRASLDIAVADCIQAGLLPDGKQCAIVPFKKKATIIPMIEGRLMLARRATPGLALRVRVVYQDDEWDYSEGLHVTLKHKPNPLADKRDENVIAAYAVAHLPGSTYPEFEVFDRSTINRYRGYSKSDGIWQSHFPEMCKKAVLGQLLKRLPKAVGAPPEPELFPDSFVSGLEDMGEPDTNERKSQPGTQFAVHPNSGDGCGDGHWGDSASCLLLMKGATAFGDAPQRPQRRPRAQQPAPETEQGAAFPRMIPIRRRQRLRLWAPTTQRTTTPKRRRSSNHQGAAGNRRPAKS